VPLFTSGDLDLVLRIWSCLYDWCEVRVGGGGREAERAADRTLELSLHV